MVDIDGWRGREIPDVPHTWCAVGMAAVRGRGHRERYDRGIFDDPIGQVLAGAAFLGGTEERLQTSQIRRPEKMEGKREELTWQCRTTSNETATEFSSHTA